jgi:hypothetical protein
LTERLIEQLAGARQRRRRIVDLERERTDGRAVGDVE